MYILLLSVVALSCNKNDDNPKGLTNPPTVTSINNSTTTTGSVKHPSFTVTLDVPDTLAVKQFVLFNNTPDISGDPFNPSHIPMVILNPKSGTYVLIDTYNVAPYHPGKNSYTSAFILNDNSTIYNSEFAFF